MSLGIFRSAVAMSGHEGRLNVLASNLANVDTPGFKRELTAAHEKELQRRLGPVSGIVNERRVDFSQGNLVRTGRQYDFALEGEGFFALEAPDGEVYSREGSFHTSVDGQLLNDQGYPLAWEDKTSVIDPTGLPIVVDSEGNVRQGVFPIGKIRIVDFENHAALDRRADGHWDAPPNLREVTATARLHQGALEGSNASAMTELIDMIALQRSYESISSVFSGLSETYQRLTRPF